MLLVLLALLPAMGIQIYNQIELHRAREAEVRQQATRLVTLIEAEHARIVEGVRQVLVTLAQTRSMREGDPAACRRLMQRLRPQYPNYINIHVTDMEGVIRCATDDAALGIKVADMDHWKDAIGSGGFSIGNYIRERSSDVPVLPFAVPYLNPREEVSGVVSIMLDLSWLEQYLARKPLPNGAALTVADRSGVVLVRVPEIPGMVGRTLPDTYTPLLKAEGHGQAELPGLDGVRRILAYSPAASAINPLFIAIGIDKEVALAPLNAAMWRAVAVMAAVMVGTLLLAWWGGHRYVRQPVRMLVQAAERWSKGEFARHSGLADGRSEFGVLGRAFDHMVDTLQQHSKSRDDALAATNQAQALLDRVMETMPIGVAIIAADGQVLRLNAAAERIWAGKREVGIEHYGEYRGCWANTGERLEAQDWAAARAVRRGETSLDEVVDIECFDGTRKTILNSAIPLLDADRRITGAVVTIEDITERHAAEKALRISEMRLRESEARYRAIVDTAVDAFVVIDKQGAILSFNWAAERIFGYTADDVIGQNVAVLMPEPDRTQHDGYLANYHRTGQRKIIGVGREVEGQRMDGSTFPLELSIAEWEVNGSRYFTGIMRDITQRRESEQALQESYTNGFER
jgi:PAS domain S-box-containing protein